MHQIRLREPWKSEIGKNEVTFTRKFHRPPNLAAEQEITLDVRCLTSLPSAISLNRQPLPVESSDFGKLAIQISPNLTSFNELQLVFPLSENDTLQPQPQPLSDFAEVCLQISE